MKEAIIYYSLNGHVKDIVDEMSGDKFEIKTKNKIISNKALQMLTLGFMTMISNRPKIIVDKTIEIDKYDIIHFVTPIWAGKVSLPIKSFLEENIIENKNIKLTVSCNGSDGAAEYDFIKLVDQSNEIIEYNVIKNNRTE
ncbi:hypothetical protein [Culicoidibacter larvae]|uniref:Flavodoxin-like domain-containing protein n=1 Tax=Culicoidibacter larvae TaxID=2579976 RepID=A0A5R8QG71_9FIRM|nr:hypothetical protein [Culicoidibacter larvae]TLG75483.1 hypothetical protein FEZ08_05415 [Culicoidibacter larvae]